MPCDCHHMSLAGGPGSLSEHLTRQFYEWEERGRGWHVWDIPIRLEPAFTPFRYRLPVIEQYDDGRQHNVVSRWLEKIRNAGRPAAEQLAEDYIDPEWYLPVPDEDDDAISEFQWLVGEDTEVSPAVALQLLLSHSAIQSPVAFELMGGHGGTVCQLACRKRTADVFAQQCRAGVPGAALIPVRPSLEDRLHPLDVQPSLVVDFGLSQEFVRPLQTFRGFDVDPLSGAVAALAGLRRSEFGLFQVLFQPCTHPWAQSMLRAVSDGQGGSFFVDAPEMLRDTADKVSLPLYATVIRVAACAPSESRVWEIARTVGGALAPFNLPSSNELIPLSNDEFNEDEHWDDVLHRRSRRCGMLLNAGELVGLMHPPTASMCRAGLASTDSATKAVPSLAGTGIVLGENVHHGNKNVVRLSPDKRTRHAYVIGASGTGKSTLLLNMIAQDLEQRQGVALLDPHGDLVDAVLDRVPADRINDVVLFDPADTEYPVGFNILEAHSELESTLLASDLAGVFRHLATTWSDQMTTVFGNAILAFLDSERGGTLSDLRRFLVEKEYRAEFLTTVRDDGIVYYWQREFPLLSGRPQSSILTRLDGFLRSKSIRNIVAQRENRLDFTKIMNHGQIFLARLSQGAIGEENAYLLGSLLVSKLHQSALARQAQPETERRPFYLYIDEFQNFVTPSMAAILTGVRKYGLGLVLAHQELRQLEKRDPEVAHAVLANPYARISFRVGESDAKKLADGFASFSSDDLLNLGTGDAVVRFEQSRQDFNLKTFAASTAPTDADVRRERILAMSRERYATPREEVEHAFAASVPRRVETPAHAGNGGKKEASRSKAPPELVEIPLAEPPKLPVSEVPVKPSRTAPATLLMGKGGQEHRYLQQLIKRWAEGMGYKASIEKQLVNGGSVDIVLEKGPVEIACEIAVTTTPEHELQNLCKCLGNPFTHVAAVGLDPKKVQRVRGLAEQSLPQPELDRLHFFEPAGLFDLIQRLEAENASHETTVRGYRVNVNYKGLSEGDRASRRELISKVVVKAMKKD